MNKKPKILEHIERITNQIPIIIYWLDINQKYLGVNKQFFLATGTDSYEKDLAGKTPYNIYPKEMAKDIVNHHLQVLHEGERLAVEESIRDVSTNEIKYFNAIIDPLHDDEDQSIIGTIGISVEITAEKEAEFLRLENERQRAEKELESIKLENERQKLEKIHEITAQVRHDIASPLTSLKVIAGKLKSVDEETRITIRNATNRINDIVNNLAIKYNKPGENITIDKQVLFPEMISCLVDSILSEKRAQYSNYAINFELHIADEAQGLFAKVSSEQFKRAFSNIINNAVEAIDKAKKNPGCISVSVSKAADSILMQIKDNGCGFSKKILKKLGVDKISTKDTDGHGIGLFTAIQQFKAWGGDYEINSEAGIGVTFTIKLPIAEAPSWFQENLTVSTNSKVIILDDDPSIHNVWEARFKKYPKVTLKHFTTAKALLENLDKIKANSDTLFLVDFELLDSKYSGIDVIKNLKISHNVFLVTSRYEDRNVRDECANLKVKIIPKNFAPYIPILKTKGVRVRDNSERNSAVAETAYILIDDDENLITVWNLAAQIDHINLATFNSKAAFEKAKHNFNKNTPIYIDYQLGLENGIQYAKQLNAEGFTTLYLATGCDKSCIDEEAPWLKDIVGKEPPFLEGREEQIEDQSKTLQTQEHVEIKSPDLENELWNVWRKIHHDLVAHPASINSLICSLQRDLPKLVDGYKKAYAKDTAGKINIEMLNAFTSNIELLDSLAKANLWRLSVKRMQLANLNAKLFPLSKYSMVNCFEEAVAEFPAYGLYAMRKLSLPKIQDFNFLGNTEIMKHIIFNLLDNALSYIKREDDGIIPEKLQIFTTSEVNYNYLHFKNNGIPLSSEDIPKLFTKFFTSRTAKAGLGLYFCKKAMNYFGGDISYNPNAEQGFTEFVLRFKKTA